jgi:hypothetical protein
LMGFLYWENAVFTKDLLRKIRPKASVYVINDDQFFEQSESALASAVMHDQTAMYVYKAKAILQLVHKQICAGIGRICGHRHVVFRSRRTGALYALYDETSRLFGRPVSYTQNFDPSEIVRELPSAVDFIDALPVKRECVILTRVPYMDTKSAATIALANELGVSFIAPRLDGAPTWDASHLNHEGAERWSKAFLQAAAGQIRRCVGKPLS